MIYASGFAGGGVIAGIRLGILSGNRGDRHARCAFYAVQPFPAKLDLIRQRGGLIEMIVTGAIVGAIYKPAAARSVLAGITPLVALQRRVGR